MPGRDSVVFRATKRTGDAVFLTAPKKVKDYFEQYGLCEVTYTWQEKQKDSGNTHYATVIKFKDNSIANRLKQKYNGKTVCDVELSTAWLDYRETAELAINLKDSTWKEEDTWKDRYMSSTESDNNNSQRSPPPSSSSRSRSRSGRSPPRRPSRNVSPPPPRTSSRGSDSRHSPREREPREVSKGSDSRHSPRERSSSRSERDGRRDRTSDREKSDREKSDHDRSTRSSSSQQKNDSEDADRKNRRKRESTSSSSSQPPAKRPKENSTEEDKKLANVFDRLGPSNSQVLREKVSADKSSKVSTSEKKKKEDSSTTTGRVKKADSDSKSRSTEKASSKSDTPAQSGSKKSNSLNKKVSEAPPPPVKVKIEKDENEKVKGSTYEDKDRTPPPEVFEAGGMFAQGFSNSEEWLKALQTMQYFQFLSSQESAGGTLINPALINPALMNPALMNPALMNPAQQIGRTADPTRHLLPLTNPCTPPPPPPQSDEQPSSSHLSSPTFLTSTAVQVDLVKPDTSEAGVQTEAAIPFKECLAAAEEGLEPARKKLRLDPKYRSLQKKCMQDFSEQASMLMITTKMLICHNPSHKEVLESSLEVSLWQLANDMEGKFWNDISSDSVATSSHQDNDQS